MRERKARRTKDMWLFAQMMTVLVKKKRKIPGLYELIRSSRVHYHLKLIDLFLPHTKFYLHKIPGK